MTKCVEIWVDGKVQGVFFRKATKIKADELQLTGWVKNLNNGMVNIHAEGDTPQIDQFIKWCHKGPKHAVVTEVLVKDSSFIHLEGFSIIR